MTEMVERVAWAIARARWGNVYTLPDDVEEARRRMIKQIIPLARAAIAAMREPTEEMVAAAPWWEIDEQTDEAAAIWRGMIDAALADTPEATTAQEPPQKPPA